MQSGLPYLDILIFGVIAIFLILRLKNILGTKTGYDRSNIEKENEDILVRYFKIDEVRQMLKEKKMTNGLTLIALQWFFLEYYKS